MYDTVVLEDWENYRKGSYRNRTYIAGSNGVLRLTVPLKKGKNQQQPITEVMISYEEPWQQQHWASIYSAYGNAPYYLFYADELQSLYDTKPDRLVDWNALLLQSVLDLLGIPGSLERTQHWEAHVPEDVADLRNVIHPKPQRQLPDPHWKLIPYPQVFQEKHGFSPNLSILDLLFCTGPEALSVLESSYTSTI